MMKKMFPSIAWCGLITLLFLFAHPLSALSSSAPMVRILLKESPGMVTISSEGSIQAALDGGEVVGTFTAGSDNPLQFFPLPSGIRMADQEVESSLLVITSSDGKPLNVGYYAYRGEILINLNAKWRLEVINRIDAEEYVKGLMKTEISPVWPFESLKAQAVVARTYTLYQIDRNRSGIYDLKASADSQVYSGIVGEDPRTSMAVDATRGEVLLYSGDYLPALYHACCGGHTEDAQYVFYDHPALIGVPCEFCKDSPHFEWENCISPVKLRNLFIRKYYRMGPITSVRVMDHTPNGGVETLLIVHSLGRDIINGKQLRTLMGNNILRSTTFTVTKDGDGFFIFKGAGWGHGVGLCQWGAKAMAEQGASYRDILSHYYPRAGIDIAY
ncbi:MAG: SpoIID/LytB domain-containing protein [bacterium]